MEYEEAKRYFKNPVCKANSFIVDTDNVTAVPILDQNFFRRRALITGATTALISVRADGEAAKLFQLGTVVPDHVEVKTQERVYAIDSTGASSVAVWEEYWDERGTPKP